MENSDIKPLVTVEENSTDFDATVDNNKNTSDRTKTDGDDVKKTTSLSQVKININSSNNNTPIDDDVKKIMHVQVQDHLEKINDEIESEESVVSTPTQDTNKKLLGKVNSTRTRAISVDRARRISAENRAKPQSNKLSSRQSELERVFEKDDEDEEDIISLKHQITDMLMGEKPIDQRNFESVIGTRTYERAQDKYKHVEMTYIHRDPMMGHGAIGARFETAGDQLSAKPRQIAGGEVDETKEELDDAQLKVAGKPADGIGAPANDNPDTAGGKFGTWDGVFVSCLLNIFGVIMFLRLGWVVGQAGIIQAILIILLAGVVTTLTTMSMAAIATNGTVKGGGAYFMISRALGPEIGGTIGILFFLGLCVAISMYVIGFCETLVQNFGVCPNKYDALGQLTLCDPDAVKLTFFGCNGPTTAAMSACKLNDIRLYGIVMMVFLLIMALIGTGWVIKVQLGLMALLTATIISFHIGTFIHEGMEDDKIGFVGWGGNIMKVDENGTLVDTGQSNIADMLHAKYTPQLVGGELKEYNFFSVFAIFFPAVTGIMAGANISGLLRNPSENIVVGTFSAIGLSTVVYAIMAFFCGAVISRTALINDYYIMMKVEAATSVMADGSTIGWLVLLGIYAATFSSALASLVGAPQMLFNVAKDRILPLGFFATTHRQTCWGKKGDFCNRSKKVFLGCFEPITSELNEKGTPEYTDTAGNKASEADPIFGYFVSFFIACGCILIGDLNFVAPLISMFFMLTYGLLNISCFFLAYYKTPGWRPTFKYFHWSGGLFGFIFCVIAMFLTDLVFAPISFCIAIGLTYYIATKKVTTNWGTALDARAYVNALSSVLHLRTIRLHAKTFRPSYLVMMTEDMIDDASEEALGNYLYSLRKGRGCVFWGQINIGDPRTNMLKLRDRYADTYKPLKKTEKGETPKPDSFAPLEVLQSPTYYDGCISLMQATGIGNLRPNTVVMPYLENWKEMLKNGKEKEVTDYVNTIAASQKMRFGTMIGRGLDRVSWNAPSANKTIDVWWLLDDGGLTLLVPYIMSLDKFWVENTDDRRECTVRLFFIFQGNQSLEKGAAQFSKEMKTIKELVKKFRFNWEIMDPSDHNLFMIRPERRDHTGKPIQEVINDFNSLPVTPIDKMQRKDVKEATYNWLRISEIVRANSHGMTEMIYITLPYPRSFYEPSMYMGWLEMLSDHMPPMILMRGNAKDCLTYFLE